MKSFPAEGGFKPFRVHLLDARLCLQDPGIVDQGGNAPEGGIDLGEELLVPISQSEGLAVLLQSLKPRPVGGVIHYR